MSSAGALPPVARGDVRAADWSLMLDATAENRGLVGGFGQVVEGIDDVAQCLGIILSNPPGTDPLRPDFACDLFSFIDMPMTLALPQIVAAVTAAIEKFEPRVELISVRAKPGDSIGQLVVTITWRLKLTGAPPQTTSVVIG